MKRIDIVFDGPPGHDGGRFVEVEDENGRSIQAGKWIEQKDGLLGATPRPRKAAGETGVLKAHRGSEH